MYWGINCTSLLTSSVSPLPLSKLRLRRALTVSWRLCKEQWVYLLGNVGPPVSDDVSVPGTQNLEFKANPDIATCAGILSPNRIPDAALRVLQNFTVTQKQ